MAVPAHAPMRSLGRISAIQVILVIKTVVVLSHVHAWVQYMKQAAYPVPAHVPVILMIGLGGCVRSGLRVRYVTRANRR
jgi:hypothetical protein